MLFQRKIIFAGTVLVACSSVTAFSPLGPSQKFSSNMPLMMNTGGGRNNNMGRGRPAVVDKPIMNDEIEAREVRVTAPTSTGKDQALGIMSLKDALAKAKEMGELDLILVNAKSDPPVCKIVDYSKYRYMQEKKAKEVKKNSKATEIKEIKMSYKIDVHDYEVRKKSAIKFLNQGNRVKCTVMFRGREVQHDQLGFELLDNLVKDMEEVCVREGRPKREGKNLALIISPKPEVMKRVSELRRKEEKAKKTEKKMKKEQKAAAKGAAATAAAASTSIDIDGVINNFDEDDDDDDDDDDLDGSIESSLDELFGSDDLTDDLFS